jgi:hypothetical protein
MLVPIRGQRLAEMEGGEAVAGKAR